MVVDGDGTPCCIWRTIGIEIKPLIAVDAGLGWDEGEGDRSRDWWLDAHRRYFGRQAARQRFEMHDGIETVFERFEILWPREHTDQHQSIERYCSRCERRHGQPPIGMGHQ